MEDRIQINGVWYRKETNDNDHGLVNGLIDEPLEFMWTKHITAETDEYVWEAIRCINDIGHYEFDPRYEFSIKFTDKTDEAWTEEHWDNPSWALGVYQNDPESLESTSALTLSKQGLHDFQKFLKHLIDIGWLPK
jgi:hypothetical protein